MGMGWIAISWRARIQSQYKWRISRRTCMGYQLLIGRARTSLLAYGYIHDQSSTPRDDSSHWLLVGDFGIWYQGGEQSRTGAEVSYSMPCASTMSYISRYIGQDRSMYCGLILDCNLQYDKRIVSLSMPGYGTRFIQSVACSQRL